MKPILCALIVVGLTLSVSAGTISLIPDNNNPDPNEEITVWVHTDTPLFCMGLGIYVIGDSNLTTAMSETDCNQYGWDNGWNSDPYIDPNGYVYLGGVRWASDANGIVSYFKFRFNRWQTRIYIDQENSLAFSWDGSSTTNASFSTDVLIFGEHDPNEPNEPNEPNVPPHYWQNYFGRDPEKLKFYSLDIEPSDLDSEDSKQIESSQDSETSDPEDFETDSLLSTIEVTSDITANQIWTADNTYHITGDIQIQALLVIEPQ